MYVALHANWRGTSMPYTLVPFSFHSSELHHACSALFLESSLCPCVRTIHPESGQALKVRSDAELGKRVFGDHSENRTEKATEDMPLRRKGTAAGFLYLNP